MQTPSDKPASITSVLSEITLDSEESLVPQIYRVLWDSIVSLKIVPGQLVSEKEISAALKSSKTPVREALIRLENVGLVTVVPKSGTYVTPIRIDTFIEGAFTRRQLEIGAVCRAAERRGIEQHLTQFETILQMQEAALDKEDYVQFGILDDALHEEFFIAAGLDGVWHFMQKTQADVNRIRHLKRISGIRRGPQVLEQHRTIVAAIQAGDAPAASGALINHIGSLESEIEKLTGHPELLAFIENQNTNLIRKRSGKRSAWSTSSQQVS